MDAFATLLLFSGLLVMLYGVTRPRAGRYLVSGTALAVAGSIFASL